MTPTDQLPFSSFSTVPNISSVHNKGIFPLTPLQNTANVFIYLFTKCKEASDKGNQFQSTMTNAQERFRNICLQEEYDIHDPKGDDCSKVLRFLSKKSKIIEIVAARDIVFALAHSGVCAAFSRETNQRICFLNVTADEVIRSLFYNKNNDSLITASVYASDNFSSLKCRSTRIEYIRRGKPTRQWKTTHRAPVTCLQPLHNAGFVIDMQAWHGSDEGPSWNSF